MYGKIRSIHTRYFRLPLEGNLVDAIHGKHSFFEVITVEVMLESGVKGVGYTYTGGIGGAAIAVMLEKDLGPLLIGKEMQCPETMNQMMARGIHYVARGGIAAFAISALDIAFWDVMLKQKGMGLSGYLGNPSSKVPTYYGGIDLMLTEKELLSQIEDQMGQGHNAFKIKLGRQDGNEDIARVRAVRRLIGDQAVFMVDANMAWDETAAIEMAKRLEEFCITWLEEPTDPDNYEAYARIGQATSIPIAMGENLHTIYEHEMALRIGHIKCPIPDASNAGGITGFVQVAELAGKEFPGARVLRMDFDTTKQKGGHEKILEAFARHEADILVGTQMIVKGHDFPGVTLVGILAADLSLYAGDYRASERTFQLLTQAAGRAGRGSERGTAVIQTYSPEHYSVQTAAAQDYQGFFEQEMAYRSLMQYPPAAHLMALYLMSEKEEELEAGAAKEDEEEAPGGLYSDLTAAFAQQEPGTEHARHLSIDLEHLQFGKDYEIK